MKAEGVVSIALVFIASGARSAQVSLCAVDNKSTKVFMILVCGYLLRDKLRAVNQSVSCESVIQLVSR